MTKVIKTYNEKMAYKFAEWMCLRQPASIRRASVMVWAEYNKYELTVEQCNYVFEHWHDYVEPVV